MTNLLPVSLDFPKHFTLIHSCNIWHYVSDVFIQCKFPKFIHSGHELLLHFFLWLNIILYKHIMFSYAIIDGHSPFWEFSTLLLPTFMQIFNLSDFCHSFCFKSYHFNYYQIFFICKYLSSCVGTVVTTSECFTIYLLVVPWNLLPEVSFLHLPYIIWILWHQQVFLHKSYHWES